ncbi:F390 synthetase-related protein [Legionella anisa]|uniref:CoF synthetase n=1 Tax=Legionella anisa TaxID=28082 RepID=A0AAX0WUD3_9GAMM|nr:F390 synthetase-related protein [Legionella anisa]AWN75442.1 CoF synthetase [Legionella anisa]KTC72816.1 coenzyme F390 synthetase FtsA [Legionella anisa]MBN5934553.1 CoF synthetase [Legionella anisa]MCW8424374.1 CoF synthetase [Legionella anisa]MCW8446508.1 CoF synthetase [Legionella anisa]
MILRLLYYYFKAHFLRKRFKSRDQLSAYQEKRFKKLVKTTLYKSPFYQPYLNKPLNEWPIINKKIMMHHFDEINTVKIKKDHALKLALKAESTRDFSALINGIAVGLSSGTSGTQGLFLANEKERDAWAGILLAKALPKGLKKKERIAFFLRANSRLYTTLSKRKKIQFHFFDLLKHFEAHIDRLNEIQPTIISAPASVLLALAKEKHRLSITPEKIFAVAEVLEKRDEHIISHAFQCQVAQVYQCTEGFLAISDKKSNHLLMNEEYVIIEKEWLDEKRFVPIITDLLRTTQPIIRYRLDDVLIEEQSNGVFTRLAGIEGRVGDICYATQNNKVLPLFADLIRQKMASFPFEFDDYTIQQHALNHFTIQISPDLSEKEALIAHLNELFYSQNYDIPSWQWQPFIKKELGAKNRRIQTLFKITPSK